MAFLEERINGAHSFYQLFIALEVIVILLHKIAYDLLSNLKAQYLAIFRDHWRQNVAQFDDFVAVFIDLNRTVHDIQLELFFYLFV